MKALLMTAPPHAADYGGYVKPAPGGLHSFVAATTGRG